MGKKGPPYENDPGAIYIVIEHPWGVKRREKITQANANNVGSWVGYMFDQSDVLVEKIYSRSTEDILIVEFPDDIDVTPLLGAHKWAEFLKWVAPEDKDRTSNIFIYNYRMNGKPERHNWTPWLPTTTKPPPDLFPVKLPYPQPTWIEKTFALSSLALPIPPPPPAPIPEPVPEVPKTNEDPIIKKEVTKPLLVDKRDPYEEDEAAQQLLQSYDVKKEEPMDDSSIIVKREDVGSSIDEYTPSAALVSSLATLQPHHFSGKNVKLEPPVVKPEAEDIKPLLTDRTGYTPNPTLVHAIQQYQGQRQQDHDRLSVKTEDTDRQDKPLPRYPSSMSSRDPRDRASYKRPKMEDERDHQLAKKIKAERNQ